MLNKLTKTMNQNKERLVYPRDENGHLFCERCGFKPKSTACHPRGNPSTMYYHMKKHTNDFPYVCSICKSGFPQKINLQNHIKVRHPNTTQEKEKEKIFRCPFANCSFQSATKGNCVMHCARRHYSEILDEYHQTIKQENTKLIHCSCCMKNFKSAPSYYHHSLKCLVAFDMISREEVETLM